MQMQRSFNGGENISHFSIFYLQSEFKKNTLRLTKQIILLIAVFSLVLTLILMPIRFEYEQMASLNEAEYDIYVNGEITKYDYIELLKEQNILENTVSSYGSGTVYSGNIDDIYVETMIPVNTHIINHEMFKDPTKLDAIGLDHFLISGELKSGDPDIKYASLSWGIAKRLNLEIDDTIIYRVGNSKYEYQISGIINPTSETEFIIEDTRAFDIISEDEEYAGNLYVVSKDPIATMDYIQAYTIENDKDWIVTTREQQKDWISTSVKESLPPMIRIGFMVGGAFLYLLVLLREQNIVIENKKKNYSILTALGATKKEIIKIHATEQVLVMIMVTFVAILISKFWIYQDLFNLYLPVEVVLHGAAIGFLLNIIAVMIAVFYTKRKISKVPVAELLR